jgi:site-specific DNA recombinase
MPSANGHGPRRVILYARVSTEEQARSGYSLAQQIERLRGQAASESYEVAEEVTDPGESGATLERPGLDRVRDVVAAGGVSLVLAQDRDRFAREPAYLYLLREEFAGHGTTLRALNDRGDDSPEGQLTDGILDQLAKFERAKTAERSRRGKKQKARQGKVIATHAAYGFRYNATRDGYVVDPERMAVMRRLFRMVGVEGMGLYGAQLALRDDGIPSPTGKPLWDLQSIRKMLMRDLYRPHTHEELRRIMSPEILAGLDPEKQYGVYWFGEHAETRKRVSENGPSGRVYRHRYTTKVRPVEERVGVPVPDPGIPREWVDAARRNLSKNRKPANAGRRIWDLSAGLLRCAECGRAMSPRTTGQKYFYYACTVGPHKRHPGCGAKKFHPAKEMEERVWDEVSAILSDPEKLRAGLDEMIERERSLSAGDSEKEAANLNRRLGDIKDRRARYQEMAAADLIDFDELRERLAELDEARADAQRALIAARNRAEQLERLDHDRAALMREYAGTTPEALAALSPEERHRVYRMMRLEVSLAPNGDIEMIGDVVPVCKSATAYRRG